MYYSLLILFLFLLAAVLPPLETACILAIDPLTIGLIAGSALLGAYSSSNNAYSNKKAVKAANETNLQISRETNEANQAINDRQLLAAQNLQTQQNEYNSPMNQRSMLEKAGLNPALSFGDVDSVGVVGLPSAIPMQGSQVQPEMMNYSDTYLTQGLSALAQVIESSKSYEESLQTNIDNQTRHQENLKKLEQMTAEIAKLESETHLNDTQRKYLKELKRQVALANRLATDSYDDMLKNRSLQNELLDSTIGASRQAAKLDAERVLTERLNRELSSKLTSAQINNLNSAAKELLSRIGVNEEQGKLFSTSSRKIEKEIDKVIQEMRLNEDEAPLVRGVLERTIKQMEQDYDNAFHYVGSALGGSGAALIKRY